MRAACGAILAIALLGTTAAMQTRPREHGRLFPPQDLGLLEAPDRDQWQRPEQIMDALGIAEASVVADVGAGSGWFTVRLARRVGTERPRLRAGRATRDARGDLASGAARGAGQRPDGAR
jgi:hypothetical protein